MKLKSNPFFKLEDFRSLEFAIEGMNLTSQVRILKGSIQLAELLDSGIGIEVPPRSCADGHSLSLDITVKKPVGNDFETVKTHITGIVTAVEGDPKQRQLVRVAFRQFSREEWGSFLDHLLSKQSLANQLIRKTRR